MGRFHSIFGAMWFSTLPPGGQNPKHKNCAYTFNNKRNFTQFLWYAHLVRVHDISYDVLIWLIFLSYRGRYIKTQKLWFNSLPLCNFWMTEDFAFIFGGVMYEGAKVCRAKELARSNSPLCHQGAKTRKTKIVITPLITGGISPNCYRTLVRVHNISYDCLIWLIFLSYRGVT
jgi:hypothetical protein